MNDQILNVVWDFLRSKLSSRHYNVRIIRRRVLVQPSTSEFTSEIVIRRYRRLLVRPVVGVIEKPTVHINIDEDQLIVTLFRDESRYGTIVHTGPLPPNNALSVSQAMLEKYWTITFGFSLADPNALLEIVAVVRGFTKCDLDEATRRLKVYGYLKQQLVGGNITNAKRKFLKWLVKQRFNALDKD